MRTFRKKKLSILPIIAMFGLVTVVFLFYYQTSIGQTGIGKPTTVQTRNEMPRRDEIMAESEPMTSTRAQSLVRPNEGESEEDYQKRLQDIVTNYNQEREEAKQRLLQESQAATDSNAMMDEEVAQFFKLLGGATILIVSLVVLCNKVAERQPYALVMTEDALTIKGNFFRTENTIKWEEIAEIAYHVKDHHYISNGRYYRSSTSRKLVLRSPSKKTLDTINLNVLEDNDPEGLRQVIQEFAPHIYFALS